MINKIKKGLNKIKIYRIIRNIILGKKIHLVFGGNIDSDYLLNSNVNDKFIYLKPLIQKADYSVASIISSHKVEENGLKQLNLFDMYLSTDNHLSTRDKNVKSVIKKIKGIKLGFLFFNNDSDKKDITKEISLLRKKRCDFILSFYLYDNFDENILSDKIAKQDIDYIIGINYKNSADDVKYQIIKEKKVIRSLGNLIQDNFNSELDRDSVLLNLKLKKDSGKTKIIEESYYPIYNILENKQNLPLATHNATYKNNSDKLQIESRSRIAEKFKKIYEEPRFLNIGKVLDILELSDKKNSYLEILNEPINRFGITPKMSGENIVYFIDKYDGRIYDDSEKVYYKKIETKLKDLGLNRFILIFTNKKLGISPYEIVCDNPNSAYFKLLNYVMNCNNVRIMVGVTGSEGKTTTKELIYNILKQKYKTTKSPYNANAGYTGYIIQQLRPYKEAYVQEISGGVINAAENNARALELTCGVVTNIGTAHLDWSKTREQLLLNKTNIKNGIINEGPLFICIDNDLLQNFDNYTNIITYSTKNPTADYYASNINFYENKSEFNVEYKGKKERIVINLMGNHNVENALVAFAVGVYNNISIDLIKQGLLEYRTEGIRQNVIKIADNTLFIDCYNTSPLSTKVAIDLFDNVYKDVTERKIMVLSDYPSLKEKDIDEYKGVAQAIDESTFDLIIVFGEFAKLFYENINHSSKQVLLFEELKDATAYLKENVKAKDIILFKAANKYILERRMIDSIFGTSEVFYRYKSAFKNIKYKDQELDYIVSRNYIFVENARNIKVDSLNMKSTIKGKPVRTIMDSAFMNNKELKCFKINSNLKNIQNNAFKNCSNLEEVVLPSNFKILYNGVFENCQQLKNVKLGDEILHIGEKCFKNCKSLAKIYLSPEIRYIAEDAFEQCSPELVIVCVKGSLAEKYALIKGIKTKVIENNIDSSLVYTFRVGEIVNLFDSILDADFVGNIYSFNALKGCVLQNGYFFTREEGKLQVEVHLKNKEIAILNVNIEKVDNELSDIPLLVNRYNGLPDSFVVDNLVEISEYAKRKDVKLYLEEKAVQPFIAMCESAKKDGLEIKVLQAYRSTAKQQEIIDNLIDKVGLQKAMKQSAPVGFSQHHLGRAIDIVGRNKENNKQIYKWVAKNGYKFGFVLKNLKNKQHITGTIYEPWHIYYIEDLDIAEEMSKNQLTQEEWMMEKYVNLKYD